MATNESLVALEQEDSEAEVTFVEEERGALDDDESGTEDDDVELENDKSVSNDAISVTVATEFLPLEKAKSPVWRFFGFSARSSEYVEKVKYCHKEVFFCKLCKNPLNYTGSTTNMIVHLQYRHLAEYNELVSLQKLKSSEQTKTPLSRGQPSIEESFGKMMLLSHSSTRWKILTSAVFQFLARDLVPIDTVSDTGFRNMLKVFEPRYTLLDRTTFSKHYLHQKQKAI